ncbi:sugar phosphate nucleotidyltransferase [Litorivicinus sp.]|nr:sugar phosphate nucleotidyltransferase [Litorivicinus sp.]
MVALINCFTPVVFSAGRGSRLKPKTLAKPKFLVKINKKRICDFILPELIKSRQVKRVIIIRKSKYRTYSGSFFSDPKILYLNNKFPSSANCSSSLIVAMSRLDGACLLFNNDLIVSGGAMKTIVRNAINSSHSIVFGTKVRKMNMDSDLQRVRLDMDRKILDWGVGIEAYDAFVTGPIFLTRNDLQNLKKSILMQDISDTIKKPCFTLFSEFLSVIDFKFEGLCGMSVKEIDDHNDIKYSRMLNWVN